MTDNKGYLIRYAMHFGTYMGVFWILKFILFPLGFRIPFFSLLFVILTLAVPFLGYYYVKLYRDKINGGYIKFSQAAMFTIFMYMFAAMLAAVAHFVYFDFIDHGFVLDSFTKMWNEMIIQTPALQENKDIIDATIDTFRSLSPIEITMQILSSDVFWGAILAIPTGLMVMRRNRNEDL